MVRVLLCVTGSVAAIKTQQIVDELRREFGDGGVEIKVAVTERAKHFLPQDGINGVEVLMNVFQPESIHKKHHHEQSTQQGSWGKDTCNKILYLLMYLLY